MNKNILPIFLIILAIGIYFTYTKTQIDKAAEKQVVNDGYTSAIENADKLIAIREQVNNDYNKISDTDKERLEKLVPNNVDNVRLTIDVTGIAKNLGLEMRNVHTSAGSDSASGGAPSSGSKSNTMSSMNNGSASYNTVTVGFGVTATFDQFVALIQDIERSLRIMDITRLTVTANDNGVYDFSVEMKTYWLK